MTAHLDSKPWLAHYPPHVPAQLPERRFAHLGDYLEDMFARFGSARGFTNFGTTLSFADVEERSRAFAAYLQRVLGYRPGDRLALMMPNILQFPVVFYGCLRAGIVVVNVNPLYTAHELRHQLMDAEVKGIVIAENFARTLSEIHGSLPSIEHVILTRFGDELGALKGKAVNGIVRYVKKLVPHHDLYNIIPYCRIIREGRKLAFAPPALDADSIAMLQYTGGTTGLAKGAILSHGNILANVQQVDFWIGAELDKPGEVLITALPLYHIFCCTVNALCFPGRGLHSILVTNPRDMPAFVKILRKYPFAVITGVSTLFKGLLQQRGFKSLDFSRLRFAVAGGMPLEKNVSEQWRSITGNVIIEGYGLTETSPVVCVNALYGKGYSGNIGYPLPSTDISLRDDDGREVAPGEEGELWVRGPQVMQGYWRQEGENAHALADGWFKTGDIARMYGDGQFRIVDRKKDMVLVSGFNVYPNEVEAVLAGHPAVLEVGCCGAPSKDSGEVVKAYIVVREGRETSVEELKAYARQHLTAYKCPKAYQFCRELPKSNVGKILRRKLLEIDDGTRDGEAS
ncbi:MAG: AMP-binding protein [Cardiobacteriaceae bacterium]|nr:AMP-binding protein [Cardiobacteriaceae bacterium]